MSSSSMSTSLLSSVASHALRTPPMIPVCAASSRSIITGTGSTPSGGRSMLPLGHTMSGAHSTPAARLLVVRAHTLGTNGGWRRHEPRIAWTSPLCGPGPSPYGWSCPEGPPRNQDRRRGPQGQARWERGREGSSGHLRLRGARATTARPPHDAAQERGSRASRTAAPSRRAASTRSSIAYRVKHRRSRSRSPSVPTSNTSPGR